MEYRDFLSEYNESVTPLFRSFEKREYLEEFLSGKIRLGHYRYYFHLPEVDYEFGQSYEKKTSSSFKSCRENKNEGLIKGVQIRKADGSTQILGMQSFLSPHYSLSFSTERNIDYGKYIIQLNNPLEFHRRVKNFLNSEIGHYAGKIVYCDSLETEENYDSRLVCLYSDSRANYLKKEYRFSYYILNHGDCLIFQDNSNAKPGGPIYQTNDPEVLQFNLPHFNTLEGIRVDDICTID